MFLATGYNVNVRLACCFQLIWFQLRTLHSRLHSLHHGRDDRRCGSFIWYTSFASHASLSASAASLAPPWSRLWIAATVAVESFARFGLGEGHRLCNATPSMDPAKGKLRPLSVWLIKSDPPFSSGSLSRHFVLPSSILILWLCQLQMWRPWHSKI